MGIQERRQRDREAFRQRILDAATELFVHEGFQGVSIRRIADKIEYAPSTIYLYFKDKASIISDICIETFTELQTQMARLQELNLTSEERLCHALRNYIEFGIAHPQHYLITFCVPYPLER